LGEKRKKKTKEAKEVKHDEQKKTKRSGTKRRSNLRLEQRFQLDDTPTAAAASKTVGNRRKERELWQMAPLRWTSITKTPSTHLLRSSNPSTKKLQKDRQKSKTIRIYKAITIPGRRALREETQDGGDNPEEEDEEEAPVVGTKNNGSREIWCTL
jgi:hypothetical protein